jgi:hypothetical protein
MQRFIKNNITHPAVLAAWALIALAATSSWVGLCVLVIAIPVIKRLISRANDFGFQEGFEYGAGSKPLPVAKTYKDLSEKENQEAYW